METAESCVKACMQSVLEHCGEDLEYFQETVDATCVKRTESTLSSALSQLHCFLLDASN